MTTNIMGFNIFNKSMGDLLDNIDGMDKVNIISGNPEVLYLALKNDFLRNSFNREDSIIIPDGVGTIFASKIVGDKVQEKIAGIDLMENIINKCEKENKKIYLLGTKDEIVKKAAENIKCKYKNLEIAGIHDGFFDMDNCEEIIRDINDNDSYALFVAMGCPRQETFIEKYKDSLKCKIFMGVGGSIDVISGEVKRAPKWMINIGLEWLYRVLKEPWRIKRLGSIPKFIFLVLKERIKGN